MKSHIIVSYIKPCGCDAEGSLRFSFVGDESPFWGYYQASDAEAVRLLRIGAPTERFVSLVWGKLCAGNGPERSIRQIDDFHSYIVSGIYLGERQYQGDTYFAIDAGLVMLADPEQAPDSLAIGDSVSFRGTFQIEVS